MSRSASRSSRASAPPPDDQTTRPADAQVSWFGPEGPDSVVPLPGQDAPLADASSFVRLYRAFLAARAALGLILLAGVLGASLIDRTATNSLLLVSLGYAVLAVTWWWWPSQRRMTPTATALNRRQALATIGVDLGTFAVLSQINEGLNINSAALMALPVLMAAVLMSRFMAVAVAAAATLILLTHALLDGLMLQRLSNQLPPAGMTGFGLFAVAIVVSELSARLAREQRSARGHLELARQQAQLNRLVIEELPEGVLVVDRQGQVRTANPAARRLLSAHGQTPPPPFQLQGVPAWSPLVSAIEQAFGGPIRLNDSREILLTFDDQTRRGLRLRPKFTRNRDSRHDDDLCVIFIEDLRQIHARARQDKLAAMGRMSAGVAHEIRNPLAAIAQANALLAEDSTEPAQLRLTSMVADNVERLKRIVDDILAVAPGARPLAPAIDVDLALRSVAEDWLQLHPGARASQLLKLDLSGLPPRELGSTAQVRFEPDHLRRVLVNLLDNALRHGSDQAGSIVLSAQWLTSDDALPQIMVSVFSDGAPIEPGVEQSLFEPFFSTRSRGTGLGLYICRELCEQHGASIDYRGHPPTQRHRNEFFILLPLAEAPALPPA